MKIVATNKKAFHDYFVIDSFEAGINLVGCEVKSVRAGEVNLKDSYAVIRGGQLVLVSAYIKNYDKGSFFQCGQPPRQKAAYAQAGNYAAVRQG